MVSAMRHGKLRWAAPFTSCARLITGAGLVFCLAGCESKSDQSTQKSAAKVQQQVPEPAVTALDSAPLVSRSIASFKTVGPLVAEQQSDVSAERDGLIVEVRAAIGDRVRKGQMLARLDDRSLRAAVDAQTNKLASLHAQVAEWIAEENMDGADLRRADEMRADKIISLENWEHTKYKVDEAAAQVEHYRAEERVEEANLRAAQVELQRCRIDAPFDGVVGRASLRPAQQVKAGEPLFWITAEAPLRILFTVPATQMASFASGVPLILTTAIFPALRQTAVVSRVSPVVDPASDSVQVIGTVTRPSPLLKAGMSMQVEPAAHGGTP
jgi:RND family efflux transporter MFP subunit